MNDTALAKQTPKGLEVVKPEAQTGKLSRLAAFTPTNLTEAIALSKLIAGSDLAPKEYKGKPANVLIAMQMGAEIGVAPMAAIQNIAVINGRPSIWGDLALAVVQVHPDYEWHKEWIDGAADSRCAVFQIKRRGHEVHTSKFSVDMAKTAKLWGKRGYQGGDTPWITSPDRMLAMRARGFGLRDKFADAMKGLRLAEEAIDIPPDTSDAKKQRDSATLDVGADVSSLTPSSQENRGHDDTGLQKTAEPDQKSPSEKTMCNECRKIDGHLEDCSQYAKWMQDQKTSKPTVHTTFLLEGITVKKKKDGTDFLLLTILSPGDKKDSYLYVWHRSLYPFLVALKGKRANVDCEVSSDSKDGKIFYQLEHIHNINGVPFVGDTPAESATMPSGELFES